MATITPVTEGSSLTFAAATSGGDVIAGTPGAHHTLYVQNAAGSAVTVTLAGVHACDQGYVHAATGAPTKSCPASETTPFDVPSFCVDPTTGHIAVTYSSATSVTVAADKH